MIAAKIRLSMLSLAMFALPAYAGGGATGGATEITQLMNHAELISNVVNTANSVQNTLRSAMYLYQSLQNLDPNTIARMAGFPAQDIQTMANLYGQVSTLQSTAQQAAQVLNNFQTGAQYMNMDPQQYLLLRAQAAQQYGGVYAASFNSEANAITALQRQAQLVNSTISQIPANDSIVGSLSTLAAQNAQTQSITISMAQSIHQANQLAYAEKQQSMAVASAVSQQQRQQLQALIQAQQDSQQSGALPDPTQVPLTKKEQ